MTLHVEDADFGRGRMNDSSSSRESSPRRPTKRSFSPTSDDGDLVVPPIPFDDTPPPPERPLLRQPVGFAWSSSTTVVAEPSALNTYRAMPSVGTTTVFLPGQAPQIPGKRKSGSSRVKKLDGPSKKRRTTASVYAEQTGRFRLQSYDPSPGINLATGQQEEPSIFRGVAANSIAEIGSLLPASTLLPCGTSSSTIVHSATTESPAAQSMQTRSSTKKPKAGAARIKKSTSATKTPRRKSAKPSYTPSPGPSSFPTLSHDSAPGSPDGSPPYHQNPAAEVITHAEPANFPTSPVSHRQPTQDETNVSDETRAGNSGTRVDSCSAKTQLNARIDGPSKGPPKPPPRMVTLLISDSRSGVVDHQLAEIKVPLRLAEDPSDGYWADAKLLSEQLQSGPSRIDGPAKVYTLRGKYRQFFLRVSSDNKDDFVSANLIVQPSRTMEVYVEALLPPGHFPLPPQAPGPRSQSPESRSPSPPRRRAFRTHVYGGVYSESRPSAGNGRQAPDFVKTFESGRHLSCGHSPSETRTFTSSAVDDGEHSVVAAEAYRRFMSIPGYRHESPYPDDEPGEIRRLTVNCVDFLLQRDPNWTDFFRAKAAMQPQRVSDVLKQYRFVKEMSDELIGQRLPFRSSEVFIEMSHITEALKIDDPNFNSMCMETLALLELYGPEGRRSKDRRIISMINDTSRPEYNSKPIKRMLHLLRDIDEEWKTAHADE